MYSQKRHRRTTGSLRPLSYERIGILMALAAGPLQRSAIAERVLADSVGTVALKVSSIYRLLSDLVKAEYITAATLYTLSEKGWRALHHELNRIEQQRRILKQRLHI